MLATVLTVMLGITMVAPAVDGATRWGHARSHAAPSTATHPAKRQPHYFSSPSRNIGCYVTRRLARCDIADHSWRAPRRPSWCHADWGDGLYLRARTHWVCASDTVLGSRRILPYGYYIKFGPMKCVSRRSGMTCRNLYTGHGFRLARASYVRF
jgi:hypothetical protein